MKGLVLILLIATAFTYWLKWAGGYYEKQERVFIYHTIRHKIIGGRSRAVTTLKFRWVCVKNCGREKPNEQSNKSRSHQSNKARKGLS